MFEERITDPTHVDRATIDAILREGRQPIVQFSKPGYTLDLLGRINQLCVEFGERLEVRFYGFYQHGFDAADLLHLPDVCRLTLDCLETIVNPQQIAMLPRLSALSFGVYRFGDAAFLERLELGRLTELTLGENQARNLDLAPLRQGRRLRTLWLHGHARNIEAVAELPALAELTLGGFPNSRNLAFLCGLSSLRSLFLFGGSRATIDELSHPELEKLMFRHVRGLESAGPLARFPRLQRLHVEDQLKLRTLDVAGLPLRSLVLSNCKTLARIEGLARLDRLAEMRVMRTNLDLDALARGEWPATLRVLALYAGSRKRDAQLRALLDQRGYLDWSRRGAD